MTLNWAKDDERKQLSGKENEKNQKQKCQGRFNEVTWWVGDKEWLCVRADEELLS